MAGPLLAASAGAGIDRAEKGARMQRRHTIARAMLLGGFVLLAGCGRGGEQTTDDPVAQNVASAAAAGEIGRAHV